MFICYTSVTLISNKCNGALALKIWNWVCSRRVPAEEEVSAASLYDDTSPRENLQTRLHWNAFKWSWRCCSTSLSANFLRSSLLTQRHALHAHKANFGSHPCKLPNSARSIRWQHRGAYRDNLTERAPKGLRTYTDTRDSDDVRCTRCHRWRMIFTLEVSRNKVKDIKYIFS